MITALTWIPRGVTPEQLEEIDEDDTAVQKYLQMIQANEPGYNQAPEKLLEEDAEIIAKYDFQNYDDEDQLQDAPPEELIEDDPYQQELEQSDGETVLPTDFQLLVGKIDDPLPTLEIRVFDQENEAFFVQREIPLGSFPLAVKWVDYQPGTGDQGSYAAITTMSNVVEIWNLNVSNAMIPSAVLQFHTAPVPGLAWNPLQRAALLTASVDTKTAVWSLQTGQTAAIFDLAAEGKAAEWSPVDATSFIVATSSGVAGFDARTGPTFRVAEGHTTETIAYLTDGNQFLASVDEGQVICYDTRNPGEAVFNIHAHEGPVNGIAVCRAAGIIATVGDDQVCRLWDVKKSTKAPIDEHKLGEGPLFGACFCPDKPTLLGVCGEFEGGATIWDISNIIN